jgi:hypothetical protein
MTTVAELGAFLAQEADAAATHFARTVTTSNGNRAVPTAGS